MNVVIIGAGFAGLNAAKKLGNKPGISVTLIDRRNYHLFQPLLYQVAMAALSPAEIATPIRSVLAKYKNITVLQDYITEIDLENRQVKSTYLAHDYDYLILACGSKHTYFGQNQWEENAPGLKTLEGATEIRRRVLNAFELAEICPDIKERKRQLSFVIVGGGPTGVELAGAIGEMSRYTLAKDFKNINPTLTRITLIEAGDRILNQFSSSLSVRASRDLESLGVQIWTSSRVTEVDSMGIGVGSERIDAATVLWAAGVQGASIGQKLGVDCDNSGRVKVQQDCSIPGHHNVFVCGDLAHFELEDKTLLPGMAPVALQQGRFVAKLILNEKQGRARSAFTYFDKGKMATIGRNKAIAEIKRFKLKGYFAWLSWLVVHIYYLSSFKNRFFVTVHWAWSYITFKRGARLILGDEWQIISKAKKQSSKIVKKSNQPLE